MRGFALAAALISSSALSVNTPYVSGQISSTEAYLYGKFIAKVKTPDVKGATIGFFTQNWQWTKWVSIEMEIVPSMEPTPLSLDLSYADPSHNTRTEYQNFVPNFEPDDDYHLYEFRWTPKEVSYYVDGQLYKSYD